MDLVFALAAFCAWTGIAGAVGYGVRVAVERWQSYRRFKRIWKQIEPEINRMAELNRAARRKQAEMQVARARGKDLQA